MEAANKRTAKSVSNWLAYAMIGAIAFVVMKFEFPIMPGVSFLKMDFSDVIVVIATFIFGIGGGVAVAAIKCLLSLIFAVFALPSLVGELAAFLASMAFALPFYFLAGSVKEEDRKSLKGYLLPALGLLLDVLSMTVVMALTNQFLLTPVYAYTSVPQAAGMHMSYAQLLTFTEQTYLGKMLHIPSMSSYIMGIIVPFNLIKGAINSVVVYILFESVLKTIKPFVIKHFSVSSKY
ncbi:ECF transporter S component [Lactobacillus delbrueckii subsp. bulgaricus]|nr:ECF transporter S component [Lactobacillus delbrueckii]AQR53445.1 membrane protein [Lactobacillus delbrueckii subsp. bulgaricus]MBT8803310.1 ECF transporter S component [Lactobacillus delbrueckii subsp. bulgaricus]MBT8807978.1 ECF transporter S component [Lactobacillus delbrueckii subsp. bulgaricus]MBT8811243.1 ECF transporter S component [Lactobacillus delbrueckii subsp. bulgaricus]MBT8817557.1 ECF transporter S component [Lactobacillus delbrueckii subsp. bulgaricus]